MARLRVTPLSKRAKKSTAPVAEAPSTTPSFGPGVASASGAATAPIPDNHGRGGAYQQVGGGQVIKVS